MSCGPLGLVEFSYGDKGQDRPFTALQGAVGLALQIRLAPILFPADSATVTTVKKFATTRKIGCTPGQGRQVNATPMTLARSCLRSIGALSARLPRQREAPNAR